MIPLSFTEPHGSPTSTKVNDVKLIHPGCICKEREYRHGPEDSHNNRVSLIQYKDDGFTDYLDIFIMFIMLLYLLINQILINPTKHLTQLSQCQYSVSTHTNYTHTFNIFNKQTQTTFEPDKDNTTSLLCVKGKFLDFYHFRASSISHKS